MADIFKPIVAYHADCADGFGAAYAAYLKLGDYVDYVPVQYGPNSYQNFLDVVDIERRDVYLLDFSFPRIDTVNLLEQARTIVWLDHHASAFDNWLGEDYLKKNSTYTYRPGAFNLSYIHFDLHRSGALLAWDHFHPGGYVPQLFKSLDDRDRWKFRIPTTKAQHAALWSIRPWTFEQWRKIQNFSTTEFNEFITRGDVLLDQLDRQVKELADNFSIKCCLETPQGPFWGLAANAPDFVKSELGEELAKRSGTYGLVWRQTQSGEVKCDLRSSGTFHVKHVAVAHGGGGHDHSAGFVTDMATVQSALRFSC